MSAVKILVALCVLALLVATPFWANQGVTFVIGLAVIEAVFALSWNLMFGYAGMASFGHAAFFAMGGYFAGAGLRYAAAPFLALLAGSALIGAASAAFIGFVALRRSSGIHFAILTLALSEVLRVLVSYSVTLGREDGLSAIPRPALDLGLWRFDLSKGSAYFWFLLAASCLLAAVLWALGNGPFGRTLKSIRQDAERAAFMGVNVRLHKLLAFTISGAVAAVAGALYAPWAQIITPDVAHWTHSTQPMLAALLGGASSFWGPILGAALFAALDYATRTLAGLSEIVIGAVLLVIVLAAPDGVIGLFARSFGGAETSRVSPLLAALRLKAPGGAR